MGTQTASSHNPGARSSAKLRRAGGKRAIPLAAKVARELGLVPTWPNLQTIRLAIESVADYFQAPISEVAAMLVRAATEGTPPFGGPYHCQSDWEKREAYRLNSVDRFWFEDARWRIKRAFFEFEHQYSVEQPTC